MKVMRGLVKGIEMRSGIAPGISGAIVGADSCKASDLWLDELPIKGECGAAILHHYRRAAPACAMNVDLTPADVDHPANGCGIMRAGRAHHRKESNHADHSRDRVEPPPIEAHFQHRLHTFCSVRPVQVSGFCSAEGGGGQGTAEPHSFYR